MAKFIRIQSTINITVTGDIDYIHVPERDAFGKEEIRNSWKVVERWSGKSVDLKQGMGYYPACIIEWSAIKNLIADGIITLGELTDTCPDQEKVEKIAKELERYERQTNTEKAKFGQTPAKAKVEAPVKADIPVKEEAKVEVKTEEAVAEEKVEELKEAAPKVVSTPKGLEDLLKQIKKDAE